MKYKELCSLVFIELTPKDEVLVPVRKRLSKERKLNRKESRDKGGRIKMAKEND